MFLAARRHHIAVTTDCFCQILLYSLKCQDNTEREQGLHSTLVRMKKKFYMYFLDFSRFVEFLFLKCFYIQLRLFGIKSRQIKNVMVKTVVFLYYCENMVVDMD